MIRARILEPALQAVIGVMGVDVRKGTGVIAIICSILSVCRIPIQVFSDS